MLRRCLLGFCALALLVSGFLIGSIRPALPALAQSNEECFQETGKCIRGTFLRYWRANGGLRQQGFPISDEIRERQAPPPAGDGQEYTVQYFERARFEYHPEFAGSENEVLLGLLGSEQHIARYGNPVPPGVGTRENPIPVGMTVALGTGWELRVVSVMPNANEAVAKRNQFNDPPQPGHQFYMVKVAATYLGDEPQMFTRRHSLRGVGASSVTYGTGCGVIPDELPTYQEVFKGGTIVGNVCWSVPVSDVGSIVMYNGDQGVDKRIYLSVKP